GKIRDFYMSGLQRCYRRGLVEDATLSGKISITFTVDPHGAVKDPEATGLSDKVDSCISDQMNAWRFAFPKDKDGDPTEVTFHISLALQAS
ncbi:MAG: AgmX/PglI C-terminal domain-containing protein, partial [Deltaproteobacteria bacterium]|nr:AgmX/PglI C-terminal domain-containing protein [Deltaproteobacteria bacterium]